MKNKKNNVLKILKCLEHKKFKNDHVKKKRFRSVKVMLKNIAKFERISFKKKYENLKK